MNAQELAKLAWLNIDGGFCGDAAVAHSDSLGIAPEMSRLENLHQCFRLDPKIIRGEKGAFALRYMRSGILQHPMGWSPDTRFTDSNEFILALDDQIIPPHKLLPERTYIVEKGKIDYQATLNYWLELCAYRSAKKNFNGWQPIQKYAQKFCGENKQQLTDAIIFTIENADIDFDQKVGLIEFVINHKQQVIDSERLINVKTGLAQQKNQITQPPSYENATDLPEDKYVDLAKRDQSLLDQSLVERIDDLCRDLQAYIDLEPFTGMFKFFQDNAVRVEKKKAFQDFINLLKDTKQAISREMLVDESKKFIHQVGRIALNHDKSAVDCKAYEIMEKAFLNLRYFYPFIMSENTPKEYSKPLFSI